jgi:transcriptional regulator with XRE-family HTH domain
VRCTDRDPLRPRPLPSLGFVDNRSEIRDFMISRRARISPQKAGLPPHGTRRVPGVRRAEVAALAGVSLEYYTRLERGNLAGASDSVLNAIARALQLDDAERTHLADLARSCGPAARRHRPKPHRPVRPNLQRMLDALDGAPGFVLNGCADLVAVNALARALFAPLYDRADPPNHARFVFLDARAGQFWTDWVRVADDIVALLHVQAARHPYDTALADLIGELTTRSEQFRIRWARHDVRAHTTGTKRLHHPVVGALELTFEVLTPAADDDQALVVYGAEPGSASADGLRLLADWAATPVGAIPSTMEPEP